MARQAASSERSASSSIRYTPSATTPSTFGEERAPSPSCTLDTPQIPVSRWSERAISPTSDPASSTPRYTPSPIPLFASDEQRSSISVLSSGLDVPSRSLQRDTLPSTSTTGHDTEFDSDTPLPSVERDEITQDIRRNSTASSSVYTPSGSTPALPGSTHGNLEEDLMNLRLNSSTPLALAEELSRPSYQRDTSSTSSAPSIHITPTPSTFGSTPSRSNRADSLVHGVSALRVDNDHQSPRSLDPDRLMSTSPATPGTAESASYTPSSSRRRRSGSGARSILHRVEDEDAPEALSRERKVQEALNNARRVTAQLAMALSRSVSHHEQGSTIQNLHQQAINLSELPMPSSRIVGLVGDSGVGKSSLINSLLDVRDLARAVGPITPHSLP